MDTGRSVGGLSTQVSTDSTSPERRSNRRASIETDDMSSEQGGAPSWLFSFVDLAFLSLIAMTQLTADMTAGAPDLGELVVPNIGEEATTTLATNASEMWQLRVYPMNDEEGPAFSLVSTPRGAQPEPPARISVEDLRAELSTFGARGRAKPLLAPHQNSRSQDLLDAAALIEEFWPDRRRALVARNFDAS
jgi:hypothetical protein